MSRLHKHGQVQRGTKVLKQALGKLEERERRSEMNARWRRWLPPPQPSRPPCAYARSYAWRADRGGRTTYCIQVPCKGMVERRCASEAEQQAAFSKIRMHVRRKKTHMLRQIGRFGERPAAKVRDGSSTLRITALPITVCTLERFAAAMGPLVDRQRACDGERLPASREITHIRFYPLIVNCSSGSNPQRHSLS